MQVYLVAILKQKIMITEKSYLEAKKIVDAYESKQLNKPVVISSCGLLTINFN